MRWPHMQVRRDRRGYHHRLGCLRAVVAREARVRPRVRRVEQVPLQALQNVHVDFERARVRSRLPEKLYRSVHQGPQELFVNEPTEHRVFERRRKNEDVSPLAVTC